MWTLSDLEYVPTRSPWQVHVHVVHCISVSLPRGALFSIIIIIEIDNSNIGVFLSIVRRWVTELWAICWRSYCRSEHLPGYSDLCAPWRAVHPHQTGTVCWLHGGTWLLSYSYYTLNCLDILSNWIYANLETLGLLLRSDNTAQGSRVSTCTCKSAYCRSSDSLSNLHVHVYMYIYMCIYKCRSTCTYVHCKCTCTYNVCTVHVRHTGPL